MEEHKYLDFLKKHWSKLALGLMATCCLAIWAEKILHSKKRGASQDFLIVRQVHDRFVKGEPLALESIDAAERILKQHPELGPSYRSMLTMTYLAQQLPEKAAHHLSTTLKRGAETLPQPYKCYGETTLLIADERYEEAYESATALDKQLENTGAYETLQALNLLRLVSLSEVLHLSNSETTEKLKQHPLYPQLNSLFSQGELKFEDWLSIKS